MILKVIDRREGNYILYDEISRIEVHPLGDSPTVACWREKGEITISLSKNMVAYILNNKGETIEAIRPDTKQMEEAAT